MGSCSEWEAGTVRPFYQADGCGAQKQELQGSPLICLYLEGRSVGGLAESGVADVGERGEHTIEEGVLLALGGLGGGLQVRKRRGNKEHG